MPGRETKIVADKHPTNIGMPDIAGVIIVVVQPQVIVIVFDVEDVRIAIGIHIMKDIILYHHPLTRPTSDRVLELYFMRHL